MSILGEIFSRTGCQFGAPGGTYPPKKYPSASPGTVVYYFGRRQGRGERHVDRKVLTLEHDITGKNNRFSLLDILGYLKNTNKNPKFGKVRQVPTSGNSQPSSLVGTCLTLPNLGFLWVFFTVKLRKLEHLKNFRNVDCVLANHNKVQDKRANLKTTNQLPLLFAV